MLKLGLLGAGRIGRANANTVPSQHDGKRVTVPDLKAGASQTSAAKSGLASRLSFENSAEGEIDATLFAASTDTLSTTTKQASVLHLAGTGPLPGPTDGRVPAFAMAGAATKSAREGGDVELASG